jgi:hypothetical protein
MNKKTALGDKCAVAVSTVLAKKVGCSGLTQTELASVNEKCTIDGQSGKVLAAAVDCRLLSSQEKQSVNDKCDFTPVNKVMARIDCSTLNQDELAVMGARCAIGKKVLAKEVACTTLTA